MPGSSPGHHGEKKKYPVYIIITLKERVPIYFFCTAMDAGGRLERAPGGGSAV
jgi:hypothetical protein